ncbi:MAG: hypothetical protein U5J98_08155 [Halobacteriales archaeon]|nr:hypothetical protein [Halobacteriales archaeon]
MADVSPSPRDRGQLILVTALALAILFVSLALIVNTAIYTENLATRGSDIGGGTEAVRYHETVRSGVGGLMAFANDNANSSHGDIRSELEAGVEAIDNRTGRLFAASDRAVTTRLDETVNGTRIEQSEETRAMTNTSDVADWPVVQDVNQTRAFTINITDATLEDAGSGDEFQVILDDGTTKWILNVTDGGTVGITNGTGSSSCTEGSTPTIDVTAGTVDGADCDGLELGEGIDTPYDISIRNGDNATGTYSLIVDNSTLADDVDDDNNQHLESPGSQPFATFAVYSANLTAVYQSPQLYYNTSIRVAPEEADG